MALSSCRYASRETNLGHRPQQRRTGAAPGAWGACHHFHDVRCDPGKVGRPAMKHAASLTESQRFRLFPRAHAAAMAAPPQLLQCLLGRRHGCTLRPEPVSASTPTDMQDKMSKDTPHEAARPNPKIRMNHLLGLSGGWPCSWHKPAAPAPGKKFAIVLPFTRLGRDISVL